MSNPYEGLQDFVAGLPELVQPLMVAVAGAIPYVEGEGSATLGIIVGINPIVAAIAGATGNILSVLLVVLLGSRVRESVVARRAAATQTPSDAAAGHAGATTGTVTVTTVDQETATDGTTTRRAKGQTKLRRWLVRFGVPGASLLAPLALPTQLTAAFFVASGVRKGWVMLWQVIAIVIWTGAVAAAATGLVTVLGW